MNKLTVLFLFIILATVSVSAQTSGNNYTLSGHVKDVKNGEELIGAVVVIKEIPATGAIANAYGFYSITIPEGKYTVIAQFLGYQSVVDTVVLTANTKLDFTLSDAPSEMDEIVVSSEKKDENITKTEMGVEKLN
ncbi:MAG TPA: carboxypeptidase-like regulatory domain-containing protein, partial [Cytophagaceae bacterium]|nr:carboxypeptidase-like regulatory domain-containing protein [Cytophagaceae bacterium]